ncbi:hypothetical protein Tco_1208385 [Tanacetum coccineum]
MKSDSELVNDLLKDFLKPPTQNPKATESPKVGEGGVSSTTTPYLAALEKSTSTRLAKKVVVGNVTIKKALLYLGASINILSASLVDKYDLGTLRKTDTIISLADRSTNIPRGILEDVIVKVDDFYYPVDFFVMDIEKLRINVFNSLNSRISNDCYHIDTIGECIQTHTPSMNLDRTLENLHCVDSENELFDGMTFHEKEKEFQMIEEEFLLSVTTRSYPVVI